MDLKELMKAVEMRTRVSPADLAVAERALRQNWFDSPATIRGLTPQDALRFGELQDLILIISEEARRLEEEGAGAVSHQQKTVSDFQDGGKRPESVSLVERHLARFCEFETNLASRTTSLGILKNITNNLVEHSMNSLYRRLKPKNPKLAKHLFEYESLKAILSYLGFRENRLQEWEVEEQDVELHKLEEVLAVLRRLESPPSAPPVPSKNHKEQALAQVAEVEKRLKESWKALFTPEFSMIKSRKPETRLSRATDPTAAQQLEQKVLAEKENLAALLSAAAGKPWEMELSEAIQKLSPLLGNRKAKVTVRVPLGNDLQVTLPSFWTLRDLYDALRGIFNQSMPQFGLKLPTSPTVMKRESEGMAVELREAGMVPDGFVTVVFQGDLRTKGPVFWETS